MISCSSKKFQYILAFINTILFIIGLYNISPNNIIPRDESILLILFYYIFILPLFIWIPFIWNRWLYELFIEDVKHPISYSAFQCIATVVLFLLAIYFIIRTFFIPIA